MVQTIIQIGNSVGVTIPSSIRKQLNLKKGQKVYVNQTPDGEAVVIKKMKRLQNKKDANKEFEKWLKVFMKENGEILDELAVR